MKKLTIFIMMLVGLVSCKNDPFVDSKGRLRLVNASFNTGDINMYIDYDPVYSSNVQYLNYSLFRDFIAGKHKLHLKNASGAILVDTAVNIEENKSYTAFLYDSMNTLKYKLLEETFITPGGSNCKVRFMHLSNDAPIVNMIQQLDSNFKFTGYANGDYSPYVSMASGQQIFNVKDSATGTTIYSNLFDYKPGFFYTLYLKGNVSSFGPDSIGIFNIQDNGNY